MTATLRLVQHAFSTGDGASALRNGWLAGVTRGLAPVMAKLGLADVDALDLDTLADRLREDAVSARAVVWTPPLVGAYARTPTS